MQLKNHKVVNHIFESFSYCLSGISLNKTFTNTITYKISWSNNLTDIMINDNLVQNYSAIGNYYTI